MKNASDQRTIMIYLAGLVASLGLLLPSSADDGPVKVRRVPSLPDAPELKAAPRAKPVATTAEVSSKPSASQKKPVIVVKKAQAVDGGPGSPKEENSEKDAQIRQREMALARAMQPKAPAPAPKKKSGRVSWTERYELGPGDTLNFGLHGQPKLAKLKVPVAPDSTISYLQAKQISVRGMTVAELKLRMESVLAEFHRKPKVIVTPAQLGSKKYTVLGKVKSNGTFKSDRPTTLIEAIAKAKGIKVGVRNSNATELADLKRSFVVRDGKKLSVDMESLYRGDMTQDVQIEPGDYIYIASNVHNETYVFGSVLRPGIVPLTGNLTVMGAIAESGSYAQYAWKVRVLLIRGSVGNPETKVINTRDILRGKAKDIVLEPGDIVYVHKRPWAYAEEIVDVAIMGYIQGATAIAIQGDESVSIGL